MCLCTVNTLQQLTRMGSLVVAAPPPPWILHVLLCAPSFPFKKKTVALPSDVRLHLTFDLASFWFLRCRRSSSEALREEDDGRMRIMKTRVSSCFTSTELTVGGWGRRLPGSEHWCCFWCVPWKTAYWSSLRCVQGPDLWLEPGGHWGAEGRQPTTWKQQ